MTHSRPASRPRRGAETARRRPPTLPALVVVPMALLFAASVGGARSPLSPQDDGGPEAADRGMSRGVALLEQFRFRDAAVAFEEVARLRPRQAAAHVNLGIARFNERDFAGARESLSRAVELDPDSPHAHYNLGLIEKLEGNSEAALAAFRRVAALDPDDSMTWYYVGSLHAGLRQLDDAEAALRRAIALQPDHESAHFSLGNVLVRAGRREEGRAQLVRFQELKEGVPGGGISAGLQYTELGPYAEAVEPGPPPIHAAPFREAVAEQAPGGEAGVRFEEATASLGLALAPLPGTPDTPDGAVAPDDYSPQWAFENLLPRLGSGVAFRDLDGDERPDLLFVRGGRVAAFRNAGGRFEAWDDAGFAGVERAVSVTIGDVDADGDPDAYVAAAGPNALFLNHGPDAGFLRAEEGSGAEGEEVSAGATFADFDHDGDLDLYVANFAPARLDRDGGPVAPQDVPGAPNRLYRNDGSGSFADATEATGAGGGALRSLGALFSDLDDDRDVDFVVVNDGAPVQVFSNDRVGTFTESSDGWGVATPSRMRGADSGDFNRDGRFDLVLTADGAALNQLLRGPAEDGFAPDLASPGVLEAGVPGARYGVSFLDADHDRDLDLLVVVNEPDALAAFFESTTTGFRRAAALGAPLEDGEEGRALALADVDGDGDLDAVVGTTRGRLFAFRNQVETPGAWMAVRARGLRSNLDGLGTKVEVRAGNVSLRREIRSTSGYLSQNDLPLHYGLGDAPAADYVRFLWPGGVKQIELDTPAARIASVEELDRKGTSCPVLYAWDGERIRFATDFLGGSALGNLLAPGAFNTPDTAEVVKFEAFDPKPRDGFYELRWVNQLEEVIFYDRAALWVADHPDDVDVFPDERLMPGPPYPPPALLAVRNRRPPARAESAGEDGTPRDVTAALRAVDREYVDDFRNLRFKGYAEDHALTLQFDDVREDADHVLLLHGWVDYADSSSNLAASHAGVSARPPVLEIDDGDGFRVAVDPMGFPAGLPKTMVVPLGGVPVGPGTRFRIRTNMRIFWDRIELAERAPDAGVRTTRLDAAEAELRFAGYPAPVRPMDRPPTEYDYEARAPSDVWGAHEGFYTRFGDVRPLLDAVDDRYVIARHGDEIRLRFDARGGGMAEPGRRRSFFVFADGFGKDMDLNSARPHSVEPLPFHAMPGYPYAPGGADDPMDSREMIRWREEYNTRYVGPEGRDGFLFGVDAATTDDAAGEPSAPGSENRSSRERSEGRKDR